MSIRNQVLTVFSLLLILALSVPYIHFRSVVTGHILKQTEDSAQKQLRLLSGVLSRRTALIGDNERYEPIHLKTTKELNPRSAFFRVQDRFDSVGGER